ncbi:MAG TPA: SH3 domain-containing protein [Chloroflexota bacterium]|nr:SH3 domain-containing protein [Chloroflexota bacterium]
MQRRELLRMLLTLAAAPSLLPLGSASVSAQESPPAGAPSQPPAQPMLPSGSPPAPAAAPATPPESGSPSPAPVVPFPAPLPGEIAQGPIPNNIVGLNVARLHQPLYIWAASDLVNANGGDWGYLTVVWTMQDREAPMAEYNLQMFLDRCFEFHVQPIVRVATKFEAKREPTVPGQPAVKPNPQGAEGTWMRPDWDEPKKWRDFFERGRWPTRHAWIVVGNEPNLGREWGGEVDAAGYARYLARFLDVFAGAPRFDVVSGALDISNTTALPVMQDALEFLDEMSKAVPGIFERLPAWASNPYSVPGLGPGARYTHLAYEAELDRIGRELPVLITEAGHLQTGDEQEIARFYALAFRDWMADPKVVAATPLFWHPDRNDFWMFELDRRGAFVHKSPTYELLRRIPRIAGSPEYAVTIENTARTTPFEVAVAVEPPADETLDPSAGRSPTAADADAGPEAGAVQPDGIPRAPGEPRAIAASTDDAGSAVRTSNGQGDVQARGGPVVELRIANTDGQDARLRAAPSRAADLIAVLPDGAVVQAIGLERVVTEESWRQVRAPDGSVGWIASDLLAPVAE